MSHCFPGVPVIAQRIMSIAFGTITKIFFVVNIKTSSTKKLQLKQDKDDFLGKWGILQINK